MSRVRERVFVGRQPIYDRQLNLYAHELLFRGNRDNQAAFQSGAQATSDVILNALFDLGLDQIGGKAPVFVNIPEDLIEDRIAEILPADRCVLEILEDVVFREEIVERLAQLRWAGYRLALDDFCYSPEKAGVIGMVDIVKLDIRACDAATLSEHVGLIRPLGVKLLAEKIETPEEFRLCRDLGFDLFQGYFLSRPEVIGGSRTPVDIGTITLLLEKCHDPRAGVQAIARIISQNATLSYRLLQSANAASQVRQTEITSVQEAVLYLGTGFVGRLATLFLLSGLKPHSSQTLLIALQRACMCELLAETAPPADQDELYLVGLLSALDLLLDQPIGEIIAPLPLPEVVKNAIVSRSGEMGRILLAVIAFEQGDWPTVLGSRLSPHQISNAFWRAARTAEEFRALLGPGVAA